jgi:hypothetical protein
MSFITFRWLQYSAILTLKTCRMIKNYLKQVKVGPGVVRAGPLFMKGSAWFTRRAGSAVAAGEKQEWHGVDDRKAWLVSPRCRRPSIE